MKKKNAGMALVMALVLAVVLLQMAISYSGMTRNSRPQTTQIDERIKLEFLARGITELAILKFQLFPSDYYACWESHINYRKSANLIKFTTGAAEFQNFGSFTESKSSFSNISLSVGLATMTLITQNKWKTEALFVRANASYIDQYGRNIDKDAIKIVSAEKVLLK